MWLAADESAGLYSLAGARLRYIPSVVELEMQALILAGGLGKRLRSVVSDRPKPMALINGRPFLEYQIRFLAAQDVRDVVLCLGHFYQPIREYFGNGRRFGVQMAYSIEREPLGTGGAIKNVEPQPKQTFLVLNGDTYFEIGLRDLLKAHREGGGLATLALVEVEDASRFGAVLLDNRGCVTSFAEKSSAGAGLVNGGIYVFEPSALDYILPRTKVSLEDEVLPALAERRLLRGHVAQGYHIDIGTPESYAEAQCELPRRLVR
jgi:D-glycero-alpha-D-manno-heptose 1-phosphate guanylyltransferase